MARRYPVLRVTGSRAAWSVLVYRASKRRRAQLTRGVGSQCDTRVTEAGRQATDYLTDIVRKADVTFAVESHIDGERLKTLRRKLRAQQVRTTAVKPIKTEGGNQGGIVAAVSKRLQAHKFPEAH